MMNSPFLEFARRNFEAASELAYLFGENDKEKRMGLL